MGPGNLLPGLQCGQDVVSSGLSGVLALLWPQLSAPLGLGAGSCAMGITQPWANQKLEMPCPRGPPTLCVPSLPGRPVRAEKLVLPLLQGVQAPVLAGF